MTSFEDLAARMSSHLDDETYAALFSPDGLARTADWMCEDQWLVAYTTTRIRHGKLDGLFAVILYKPVGPGSQSGKAQRWERVKVERCKTRKEARQRAETHYYAHSPQRAAKHGRA